MAKRERLNPAPTEPKESLSDMAGNRPPVDKQPEAPRLRSTAPEDMADKGVTKARMDLERKRRMFVKRTGGFLKGLHPDDKAEGERICEEYGRKAEDGWDPDVWIEGFDNVDHEQNQAHVKPRNVK